GGDLDPQRLRQLRAEAACALLEDDLLAAVGLAVGAAGRLGVGEVLRHHVHAHALGGERRRGDLEAAEHQTGAPIAALRIPLRAWATWTAAWCSSALAASLADSASTSTVEPSARTAPA